VSFAIRPGILALLIYFLALSAFTLLKRRTVPGKTLYLLRALFPSWRFFEDFDGESALFLRQSCSTGNFSEWQRCLPRAERRAHHLLFNPKTNYILAVGSLVQQLLAEISDLDCTNAQSIEKLVSYQMVRNLVESELAKSQSVPRASQYQFKVSGSGEDWLVSPVYEIQREAK
jgi:hypothetical protein